MFSKEQTDALNCIPIRTVGNWLGVRFSAHASARCPFQDHEDTNPSFEIRRPGNRWICYGCDRHGGSIDFVMTYKGVNFLEAKRWLADRTRLTDSSTERLPPAASYGPYVTAQTVATEESLPDYELYEAFLGICPLLRGGWEYLAGRGLSKATIAASGIGELSESGATLRKLRRVYGFQRVNSAGLMTKRSTQRDARLVFPQGSLVFPFFENRRIAYLQVRAIGRAETHGKWRNLNFRRRRIYNVEALFENKLAPIAVCEGIMDTLSAVELGWSAIGMMGVSATLAPEQMERLRGREVNILLDWDTAGEARSAKLQAEMRLFGIASTRKRRPSATATDLNEYLMERKGQSQRL